MVVRFFHFNPAKSNESHSCELLLQRASCHMRQGILIQLSRQLETLLKNELLNLVLARVLKFVRGHYNILYIVDVSVNLLTPEENQ